MRASFFVVVLVTGAALVGCGSSSLTGSTGTGGTVGRTSSPGQVTFVLTTPPDVPYCHQLSCSGGGQHLSIIDAEGTELNWQGGTSCGVECSTCQEVACPLAATIFCPTSEGFTYTGGTMTWDGLVTTTLTCGAAHSACSSAGFEHPGGYIAKFCATPGTVTQPDAGPPVCTSTGPEQCVQLPFQFPADGTIHLQLTAPSTLAP